MVITTPDEQGFLDGVVLPGGSVLAAETLSIGDTSSARLVSLNGNGLDGSIDVKLNAFPKETVYSLIADGASFAFAGSAVGAKKDVLFGRVSATGAVQLQTPIDLGGNEEAYGLLKVGSNFAVYGYQSTPAPGSAFLALIDNKGSCINKDCKDIFYTAGANSTANGINRLAILPDGSYLAAGEGITGKFGNADAVMWHIAADGKEISHQVFGGEESDTFYGLQALADGGAVLFGAKGSEGWLVGVDAQGAEKWQALLPGTTVVNDMQPSAFGWTVAASTDGGQLLLGVDAIGNVLWKRTFLGRPARLVKMASGYAIVGDLQGDAQVIFTDPWGFDSCAKAKECLGVTTCSDSIACTDDICDSVKGCVHTQAADGQPCGGGDGCISQSSCAVGKCTLGKVSDCNDKNPCTDDSCDKAKGCVNLANAATCDDADACTSSDICASAKCAGLANDVTITCNDSDDCTADTCDAKTGCAHSKQTGTACDDSNFCTKDDVCLKGNCTGVTVACNDGNLCTDDSCAPLKGCIYAANTVACDDASACTSGDACAGAKCAGKAVDCDDKNACTDDSCDKLKGCVNVANAATCTDGDACTVADTCAASKCAPGGALKCDDANLCTDDTCDKFKGCVHASNTEPCSDGDACTVVDGCAGGKCVGQLGSCDDKNVCTDDSCDKLKGCVNVAVKDGVACADGVCFGGKCGANACVLNGGKEKLFNKSYGSGTVATVEPLPDGGYLIQGGESNTTWFVRRLDAAGGIVWDHTVNGSNASSDSSAAVVAGGASVWQVGSDNNNVGRIRNINIADGKAIWDHAVADTVYCVAISAHPNGGAVIGAGATGGGLVGAAVTFLTDGKADIISKDNALWWNIAAPASKEDFTDVTHILPNGDVLSAGRIKQQCFVQRIGAQGQTLWLVTLDGTSCNVIQAVTHMPDASIVGVGTSYNGNEGWFLRFDAAGQKLAQKSYNFGATNFGQFRGVALRSDGVLAVTGGNGTAATLNWVDPSGAIFGTKTWKFDNISMALAVSATPDGGFVLGGQTTANVVRVDAWGNDSCASSGICATKTAADCDDKNPCTADTCDPIKSCQHASLADASACGDGKTCKVGICQ